MKEEKLTYAKAMQELDEIVQGLAAEGQDIDTLGERLKRADFLLHYCRKRLAGVSNNVKKLLGDEQE